MHHIPRLSEAVYVGLCREVGTPSEVKIRRDVMNTKEMLDRQVKVMEGLHEMTSGSYREGFRLRTSDVDKMYWPPDHKVICDLSQISLYRIPQHTVILMEWEDLPPGFTRLKLITESNMAEVRSSCVNQNDEQYIYSELFRGACSHITRNSDPTLYCVPHRPCTSYVRNEVLEVDHAYCLASQHWPTLALPWIERCRQKQWPPDAVLHDIVKSGFHVVPIGSDHTKGDEWRISFSQAEQKLVYSMNHVQFLCYGLMKIFLKVINSQVGDPILCSYFMKTILFWVIQENVFLTWTPDNLLAMFWKCFQFLICRIQSGECPNFFIPQNNMFRVKVTGAAQALLFDQVYSLYCKGIACLLLSPTLRPYLSKAILNKSLEFKTNEDSIISTVNLDFHIFYEIYKLRFLISDVHKFADCMRGIAIFLRRRQGPYQVLCIQRITSDVLINAAWYLAQYTGPCNKSVTFKSDKVCHMLKIASKIGYVSDILYLAMYYYRTCRYEQSLSCLQTAQERMSVPYVMYYDVNVEMYRRAMTGVSLSDKMRKAVVSDIILDNDNTYIDELLLEQTVSYMNGAPILFIPPLVMLHMLTVLNHNRLRHTLESHQALEILQALLLYDDGVNVPVPFRDISYQILGICQHVCGDHEGALNSYQYSLQQYPLQKIQQASIHRMQSLI